MLKFEIIDNPLLFRNDASSVSSSNKKHLILWAILFSLALHAIVVVCVVLANRSDSQSALWSGGQGNGSYDVAFVELGDLKIVSEESDDSDMSDLSDGSNVHKKQKVFSKKVASKQSANFGQGASNTPSGGVGNGLDASGVSSENAPCIIAEIRKRIARQKTFPEEAKEKGWEGVVTVQFQINATGQLDFVKVAKSSGYAVLDQSATAAVSQAAPFPYLAGVIQVPMEYRLNR